RPLSEHEERRLAHLYSEKVERYLDAGYGTCYMNDDRVAAVVANALLHFEGSRYSLAAWCVMPNHVHVVVQPFAGRKNTGGLPVIQCALLYSPEIGNEEVTRGTTVALRQ